MSEVLWHTPVVVGSALEGAAEGNGGLVAEWLANELQPNWQSGSSVSGGDDERRKAKIVDWPHQTCDFLDRGLSARAATNIGFLDGRRSSPRSRRDDEVDLSNGSKMCRERGPSPSQGLQIFNCAIGKPVLQACTDLNPLVSGAIA